MLALYFDGQPQIKEVPRPEPGPGEVLVSVHLAGICRTDLEVLKGYHGFTGIMGHEFVGQVAGPEDSPWLGQRVVGEINLGCGACDLCRRGLAGHCRQRRVLGLKDHDGAFAPYLTLPAANLHAVPPEVPDVFAVFTEPLAAALRVLETVPVSPAARVLVVGDGSLGLQISWVLALSGAEIHLAGHHPEHLALARPRGVETFLSDDLPPGDYDLVVEASGSPTRSGPGPGPGPAPGHGGHEEHVCGPVSPGPGGPGGPRGQPGGVPLRALCRRPASPPGRPG